MFIQNSCVQIIGPTQMVSRESPWEGDVGNQKLSVLRGHHVHLLNVLWTIAPRIQGSTWPLVELRVIMMRWVERHFPLSLLLISVALLNCDLGGFQVAAPGLVVPACSTHSRTANNTSLLDSHRCGYPEGDRHRCYSPLQMFWRPRLWGGRQQWLLL